MPATIKSPRMAFARSDDRLHQSADMSRTISDRAEWCLPEDRALIHAMYRQGLTAAEIAQLRETPAPIVRRRLNTLVRRVLSPKFQFVLRRRDGWPPLRRRAATVCILQGRTLRDAANHLQVSLHTVRREMEIVGALFNDEQTGAA